MKMKVKKSHEVKNVLVTIVKTEVEEVDDDDDIHVGEDLLRTVNGEGDGRSECDDDPIPNRKRKNILKTSKGTEEPSTKNEAGALRQKQRRAQMTPEEKEKEREKDKLRKQNARKLQKEKELNQKDVHVDRRRSRRQVTPRPILKYETEESTEERDDDEDFKTENAIPHKKRKEIEEGGGTKKTNKKKVSEMNEEEREVARAIWREEARKRRELMSRTTKSSGESHTRISSGGGKRKKASEMTYEEREAWKAKEREAVRLRRARQRATMSPEEREAYLAQQREYKRLQREQAKATMTDEQREEVNRKASERRKSKSALVSPEKKKEESQKSLIRTIVRQANWTDEQKQEYRNMNYMQRMARAAKMTPEEIEKKKQRSKELRMAKQSPQEAERRRQVVKKWRDDMDPDRRQQYLDKLKECYRRRVDRLKQDPQRWEEVKQRWRMNRIERMAKEENEGGGTRKGRKRAMTELDKERKKEKNNMHVKRYRLRRKLTIQRLVQSGMSMDEIAEQLEPPEKRERRLIRCRVTKAKLSLKQQLERCGASPEEIEKRLEQVPRTYTMSSTFRPYKPKQETLMPIAPDELILLQNVGVDRKTPSVPLNINGPTTSSSASRVLQKPSRMLNITLPVTSKTTQVRVRRTRPPKILELENFNSPPNHHPPVSPASKSSIDHYHPHQSQGYSQHQHQYQLFQHQIHGGSSLYPHHYQHQPQAYPIQNILDTIPHYHEQSSCSQSEMGHPHQQHQTQPPHHKEYASDHESLPPSSPIGEVDGVDNDDGDDYDDGHDHDCGDDQDDSHENENKSWRPLEEYNNTAFNNQIHRHQPPQKSYTPVTVDPQSRKRIGARKPRNPNHPRHGPRGPQHSIGKYSSVVRDVVCDECGNEYNSTYLREHKVQFHNPHYKNQTCLLCGEKFGMARKWYKHYIHNHPDAINNKPKNAPQQGGSKEDMCDICGASFRSPVNLRKHKFSIHGDGLKKENFKKCPICPDEKLFKNNVSLYTHFRRKHPGYNRQTNQCHRCPEKFGTEQSLSSHVKETHPGCYFPCQYCNVCRFSQLALNFHTLRCTKTPAEIKVGLRKKETEDGGMYSLDRAKVPCECCERNVAVFSLTRHYWEMHKVKEDKKFTCTDCGKEFRSREFWLVHMEEMHEKGLEEMMESVGKLNVADKEGLEIENQGGVWGGVPGNTPRKAAVQRRVEEMGGRMSRTGGKGKMGERTKVGRRKKEKKDETDTEQDEKSEEDYTEVNNRVHVGRRRNIVVVAEEDKEEEEERDGKVAKDQNAGLSRKRKMGGKGKDENR